MSITFFLIIFYQCYRYCHESDVPPFLFSYFHNQ
jgi:hypothetical protein